MTVFTENFSTTTYKDAPTTTTWSGLGIGAESQLGASFLNTMITPSSSSSLVLYQSNKKIAQKITAGTDSINGDGLAYYVILYLKKTGAPTGTISVDLYTDGGSGPGSLIETSYTTIVSSSLTTSFTSNPFYFNATSSLISGNTYYIVIRLSGTYSSSNYVSVSSSTGHTYSDGSSWTWWTPGPWTLYSDSEDLRFVIYHKRYETSALAQSTKINGSTKNIVKATLTATDTIPSGTSIAYYLSANGGTNWEEVNSGVSHTFTITGNDLRWKALLTTNGIATSKIVTLSIDYTTADITNPTNALANDSSYATCAADTGVISVQLSKDGGTNYNSILSNTFTGTEETKTYGGDGSLWGTSWTGDDVDDTSFRLKIICGTNEQYYQAYKNFGFAVGSSQVLTGIEVSVKAKYTAGTASINYLTVKIYYGTSVVSVSSGSIAYISDEKKVSCYNGSSWKRLRTDIDSIIYVDGEKYTTIQDAIDDLPAEGGKVIVPAGTYTISSGISRDISNVTIKGSGRSTIINTTSAITVLTAGDFWTIEDLYIKGNNTGTQDGIRVDGKSGVTIQGCIIEDMGRYGIYGVGSASTTINKIINNQIIDCDYNVIVSNPSTRWLIRGNISRDSNYDGIYYRGHNAVISDNHCFDNGRQGIALEGRVTATTYSCDYNIITNNICDNNAHSGLHIENDCNYNTIIGNISINNTLYGMNVATSTCEYNNIINNTLLNNDSANWNDTSIGSYNNWKDNIGITIRCKAYLNTSTQDNIATGTQTHVLLNAEVYDTGSNFNTSTSTFTAPLDGYYNITGSVGWVTGTIIADKRWFTAIRVNDVEKTAGNQHSSHTGSIVANCTDRLYLAAGDTVKLYAFHDGGAATPDINTGQNVTFLTIDYVGSY